MRRTVVRVDLPWPLFDGRLTVRPADVADVGAFFDYKRLPMTQAYVDRIVDDVASCTELVRERTTDPSGLLCAIVIDGQVVGDIGGRRYRPETLGFQSSAWDFEIGFTVHPKWWGRGVATAAVGLLVPVLHREGGIRRIVAKVFAENRGSLIALLRNDFVLEGTERAAVLNRYGVWLDDCTLAHLR